MTSSYTTNPIIGTLVPGTVAIYVPTNYDSNREKELVESTLSLFEKSYSNYDKHFPLTVEVRKTDDSSLIDKAYARRVNIGSLYKENYVSATITDDGKWVKAFLDKLYDILSLEDIPVYEVELRVQEALIKAEEEKARQQAEADLLVQNAMMEAEEKIARQQAEIDTMIQQAIIDRELDLYEQEEEALANLEIELAIREAEAEKKLQEYLDELAIKDAEEEEKLQEYLDELAIKDAEEEEKLQEYLDELAIKDAEEEEKLQEYLDELAIKDAEEEEIFQEKLDLEYEKVLELQAEQDPISQEDAQRIFGHLLRPTKQEASKPTTKSDDCLKQIVQDYREAKSLESERQELLDNISALIVDYVTRTHDVLPQEELLNVIKGKIVLSEDTLSSIVINKDKRIILPDYNELELKLRPIPKTLYLLFLKHPEGIILKNIPDYKDELRHIYLYEVNPNRDDDVLERSLDKLCDPEDNAALRYNIAIIKKAVKSKIMNEMLAMHYYISGRRGEEFRIPLSRDKVRFA